MTGALRAFANVSASEVISDASSDELVQKRYSRTNSSDITWQHLMSVTSQDEFSTGIDFKKFRETATNIGKSFLMFISALLNIHIHAKCLFILSDVKNL